MRILKFGGTSVGSIDNIQKVIAIVSKQAKQHRVAVVVSAVGGITDILIKAGQLAAQKEERYQSLFEVIREKHIAFAKALTNEDPIVLADITSLMMDLEALLHGIFLIHELSPKTMDKLTAFGELTSSRIIAAAFNSHGTPAELKDSRQLITTDSAHTKATVDYDLTNKVIVHHFKTNTAQITILPGFIARTSTGETSTLGRGGSDFTAAIIAAAVHAAVVEIWTDVSGMFSANPKLVKQAQPILHISYDEAMELSHFGAKVLYPPTIVPVMRKDIPIHIKNTLEPEAPGTRIGSQEPNTTNPIKGISHVSDIALLTIEGGGMVGITGTSKRLFETLSQQRINVILITQASSEHSICIGVMQKDAPRAKEYIDTEFAYEISLGKVEPLIVEDYLAIIALVGEKMKSHQGISGKMFRTLGKNNVNIRAIAQGASEKNISAVIAQKDVKKALNSLHERFFEDQRKQLNLFIMGVGNVGGRLMAQIEQQQTYLSEHFNLSIRVMGISNSRTMVIDEEGIDLSQWRDQLASGEKAYLEAFRASVI
ncbi:MAG: aspartokinase/homoserine dehydrogenase 1, partial [Flavobacteriales bacterium]